MHQKKFFVSIKFGSEHLQIQKPPSCHQLPTYSSEKGSIVFSSLTSEDQKKFENSFHIINYSLGF